MKEIIPASVLLASLLIVSCGSTKQTTGTGNIIAIENKEPANTDTKKQVPQLQVQQKKSSQLPILQ